MKLYYGDEEEQGFIAQYVANQVPGCERGFGNCRAVGVLDVDENLAAGWVWHDWNPEAGIIEFSGAATDTNWMTRSILHELFSWAFDAISCQMVVSRNRATNTRLHRQLKAFGFKRTDIPRLYGRFEHGVLWRLTDDAWRESRFYMGDARGEPKSCAA